ncbi:transcriptional activator RfaH [Crateriforma conspicua]|uniref:Transcriptional activator RfaH n=1 Tax=Crateriforma conspicua TaxID=2527996 RepID=A0A5C6G096_9PLAN|nr:MULTISPECIES: transcription termination/antitermination NusG family protein [Crateriforma]TWU66990.1 transcriptional activator RfaH [Crateriforma conspicua]
MPILAAEPDRLPDNLFDLDEVTEQPWWMVYTNSRQEKQLMRHLRKHDVPHYGPLIPKRYRSPAGRIRTSFLPLFTNYVFVMGDNEARYQAVCSGCVSTAAEVPDSAELVHDLRQIHDLIEMDVPLTLESKIEAGQLVRVRNGAFAGYEGTVVRREGETRLLVAVRFMEQGVSVALEDCQVEAI